MALYDCAPMPRWSKDHVTLLGDAGHPTLPFMAHGAAIAIQAPAVRFACLSTGPDVRDPLTVTSTCAASARLWSNEARAATPPSTICRMLPA